MREDDLSGLPGIEVCRRHGVDLTAMRNRAARKGLAGEEPRWRQRRDGDPLIC